MVPYKYQFPASNVYAKGNLGFAQTKLILVMINMMSQGLAGGVGLGYNLFTKCVFRN